MQTAIADTGIASPKKIVISLQTETPLLHDLVYSNYRDVFHRELANSVS